VAAGCIPQQGHRCIDYAMTRLIWWAELESQPMWVTRCACQLQDAQALQPKVTYGPAGLHRAATHWATRTTDFLPRHITTVARSGRRISSIFFWQRPL